MYWNTGICSSTLIPPLPHFFFLSHLDYLGENTSLSWCSALIKQTTLHCNVLKLWNNMYLLRSKLFFSKKIGSFQETLLHQLSTLNISSAKVRTLRVTPQSLVGFWLTWSYAGNHRYYKLILGTSMIVCSFYSMDGYMPMSIVRYRD